MRALGDFRSGVSLGISDLVMGVDGRQLWASTPVLGLTGWAPSEAAEGCQVKAAIGTLHKVLLSQWFRSKAAKAAM